MPAKESTASAPAATIDAISGVINSMPEAMRGTLRRDDLEAQLKASVDKCIQTGRDQALHVLSRCAIFFHGASFIDHKCHYLLN